MEDVWLVGQRGEVVGHQNPCGTDLVRDLPEDRREHRRFVAAAQQGEGQVADVELGPGPALEPAVGDQDPPDWHGRQHRTRSRPALVAQVAEQVPRHGGERVLLGQGHLGAPPARASRVRRPRGLGVVGQSALPGHRDAVRKHPLPHLAQPGERPAVVVQHRGVVVEPRWRRRPAAARPRGPPPDPRSAPRCSRPGRRPGAGSCGPVPSSAARARRIPPRREPGRPQRQGHVAAVAHDVDEVCLGQDAQHLRHELPVDGGLVPPAGLAPGRGVPTEELPGACADGERVEAMQGRGGGPRRPWRGRATWGTTSRSRRTGRRRRAHLRGRRRRGAE